MLEKPWYPFLLSLYPFLYLYSQNSDIASVSAVLFTCAAAVIICGIVLLAARLLLGSIDKAALIASIVMFLSGTHGYLYESLMKYAWTSTSNDLLSRRLRALNFHFELALLELFIALAALLFIKRFSRIHAAVPSFLNVFAGALVLIALSNPFVELISDKSTGAPEDLPKAAASAPGNLPDVYYIILDGYARRDMLKRYYDFDNSEFISWLESRGFTVAERSQANFNWTYLSLSSSLNLEYITRLSDRLGSASRNRTIPYRMIKYNNVARTFRGLGYQHLHLQSTWGATMHNPAADRNVPCSGALFNDEFYRTAAEVSILSAFPHAVSFDLAECHLQNFRNLAEIADDNAATFTFAHFIPPHHPYLFNKDGKILRTATVSNQFEFQKHLWGDRRSYIEQLQFVNGKIREAVQQILQRSATPPIIVIQSDHGSTVLDVSEEEALRARLANFTAIFAGGRNIAVPDDISPVNIFRLIFSEIYGLDMPLLENKHFQSGYDTPFAFHEVPHEATEAPAQ